MVSIIKIVPSMREVEFSEVRVKQLILNAIFDLTPKEQKEFNLPRRHETHASAIIVNTELKKKNLEYAKNAVGQVIPIEYGAVTPEEERLLDEEAARVIKHLSTHKPPKKKLIEDAITDRAEKILRERYDAKRGLTANMVVSAIVDACTFFPEVVEPLNKEQSSKLMGKIFEELVEQRKFLYQEGDHYYFLKQTNESIQTSTERREEAVEESTPSPQPHTAHGLSANEISETPSVEEEREDKQRAAQKAEFDARVEEHEIEEEKQRELEEAQAHEKKGGEEKHKYSPIDARNSGASLEELSDFIELHSPKDGVEEELGFLKRRITELEQKSKKRR